MLDAFGAFIVFGCMTLFNVGMALLIQILWKVIRPEHPIDFVSALVLWLVLGTIISLAGRKK